MTSSPAQHALYLRLREQCAWEQQWPYLLPSDRARLLFVVWLRIAGRGYREHLPDDTVPLSPQTPERVRALLGGTLSALAVWRQRVHQET